MKTALFTVLIAFAGVLQAQDWPELPSAGSSGQQEFTFSTQGNSAETIVTIEQLNAPIKIQGIAGSEIKIIADDYAGLPEKAEGLKSLSASGPENTGIGLSVSQEGNRITISGAHREADDAYYYISLPKNMMLSIDYTGWQAEDLEVRRMEGEIEAKSQVGDLLFVDIKGPIVAHSLSSDIDVIFTTLSQATPSSITSTSGDIDVTLPETSQGNFQMNTLSGGVYTNLDFDLKEEGRSLVGHRANGTLGGGGVSIQLKTISGDIYVRKPKK